MGVTYITLKGYIKNGELELDLPENVADGEVEVRVAVESESSLESQRRSLGEILESEYIGSWADMDITDSQEWVEEQRRKMWAERRSRWTHS
jgi:phosphatidate phosphatase APP1